MLRRKIKHTHWATPKAIQWKLLSSELTIQNHSILPNGVCILGNTTHLGSHSTNLLKHDVNHVLITHIHLTRSTVIFQANPIKQKATGIYVYSFPVGIRFKDLFEFCGRLHEERSLISYRHGVSCAEWISMAYLDLEIHNLVYKLPMTCVSNHWRYIRIEVTDLLCSVLNSHRKGFFQSEFR